MKKNTDLQRGSTLVTMIVILGVLGILAALLPDIFAHHKLVESNIKKPGVLLDVGRYVLVNLNCAESDIASKCKTRNRALKLKRKDRSIFVDKSGSKIGGRYKIRSNCVGDGKYKVEIKYNDRWIKVFKNDQICI
jgi:hypothetical protein